MRSQDKQSDRLARYVESYDKLIYGLSIIAGFHAAIDLFTSKIIPHKIFYFPLRGFEKAKLQNYRFVNTGIYI